MPLNPNSEEYKALLNAATKPSNKNNLYQGQENLGFENLNEYDKGLTVGGDQDATRASNQSAGEQALFITKNAIATFGTAMLQDIAATGSLIGTGIHAAASGITGTYEKNQFTDDWLNNNIVNGIDSLKNYFLSNGKIYLTKEQQNDTGLLDYMTSGAKFWDDLGQGLGFMAAQIIPTGLISKPFAMANRTAKGIKEAGMFSKWLEEAALAKYGLKNLDEVAKAKLVAQGVDLAEFQNKLGTTSKWLQETGVLTGSMVGRIGESAMESKQTYDELIAKEVDENTARTQANNVFAFNMALSIPDAFMYTSSYSKIGKIFGGVSKLMEEQSLEKGASKLIEGTMDAGFNVAKRTKLEKAANYIWKVGKTAYMEQEEEGLQNTFQDAAKLMALDDHSKKGVDNYLEAVVNKYSDSWTTIDGQKARLLGGILGGGATSITARGEGAKEEKLAGEMTTGLNESILQKDKLDPAQFYTTLPDGTKKISTEYLRTLNNHTELEVLKEQAAKENNIPLYNRLHDLQLFNQTFAFSKAGKLDDLIDRHKMLGEATNSEINSFYGNQVSEEEGVNQTKKVADSNIEKIKKFGKIHESLQADPTLNMLNSNQKRVVATKLANFQINNSELNDHLNPRINELESENLKNFGNYTGINAFGEDGGALDSKDLKNLAKQENAINNFEGLQPNEKEELLKLQEEKKRLSAENLGILSWYDKLRTDLKPTKKSTETKTKETSTPITTAIDEFHKEKNVVNTETKIAEETKKNAVTKDYEENTGVDDKGEFKSNIFTVDGKDYQFEENKPDTLSEVGNPDNVISVEDLYSHIDGIEEPVMTGDRVQIKEVINKTNTPPASTSTDDRFNPPTGEVTEEDLKVFRPAKKSIFKAFKTTTISFINRITKKITTAESQQRFNSYVSEINILNTDNQLLVVTYNHPTYGYGKENSIYDDTITEEENKQNIKVIVVDKEGNPINHKGGMVYCSLFKSSVDFPEGGEDKRFVLSGDEIVNNNILSQYTQWRNQILNNTDKELYLTIVGQSKGIIQKSATNESVVGRLRLENGVLVNENNLNKVQINVAKGKEGYIQLTLSDGSNISVKNGIPYVNHNGQIVPLIPRRLNNTESQNAFNLIKKYFVQLGTDKENKLFNAEGEELKNITTTLKEFLYMKKDGNPKQLWINIKEGTLTIGNDEFTKEQILSGDYDSQIISFLNGKYHQISTDNELLDINKPYKKTTVNDKGEATTERFKNYTEYLLKGETPVLSTNLQLDNSETETSFLAPQFANGYFVFDDTLRESPIKEERTKLQPSKLEDNYLEQLTLALEENDKILTPDEIAELEEKAEPKTDTLESKLYKLNKKNPLILPKILFDTKLKGFDIQKSSVTKFITEAYNKGDNKDLIKAVDELLNKSEIKEPITLIDEFEFTEEEDKPVPSAEDMLNRTSTEATKLEKPINTETEKEWFYSRFPDSFSIEEVRGLIDGHALGQVQSGGKVLLSGLATEGTTYHEGFHIVSNFLIPQKERLALYKEYRERTGQSELTDLQAEEALAEEFRTYVLLDGNYKIENKNQENWFKKIYNFLKSLLGLNKTENLFEKIRIGGFKNATVLTTKLEHSLNSSIDINLSDPSIQKEVVSGMNTFFFNEIFKDESLKDLFIVGTGINAGIIYDKIQANFKTKFAKFGANTPVFYKLAAENNDFFKTCRSKHTEYLERTLGVKFKGDDLIDVDSETNYEDKVSEDNRTKDVLGIDLSMESSTKDGLPKAVKLLIIGLNSYNKEGRLQTSELLGLPQAIDFNNTLNHLQLELSDINDYEQMIEKLKQLGKKSPNNVYNDLLKHLKSNVVVTPENLSLNDIYLQDAFFKQFSQTKNDFELAYINDEGNVYYIDSNAAKQIDKIKEKWRNNIWFNPTKFVLKTNGKLLLNTKAISELPIATQEDKIDFFKALGVEFTEPMSVNFGGKDGKEFIELRNQIIKTSDVSDLFDKNQVDAQNRWNYFVLQEVKSTTDSVELQHINPDGKTIYGITLNTYLSNLATEMNNGRIPDYLLPKNNPYATHSLLLKRLDEGDKIKIEIVEGMKEENEQQGVHISKLEDGEMALLSFTSIMNNKHHFLRASDKKTEFAVKLTHAFVHFGSDITVSDMMDDATNIFVDYLRDELAVVNQSEVNKNFANYKKNTEDLIIFKGIIKQDSLRKEIIKNDITAKTLPYVKAQIQEYINLRIAENIELAKNNKLLVDTGKGFNYRLPLEVVQKVIGKRSLLQQLEVNKLFTAFTVNSLIGNIEQTKIFTGSPAFYKNAIDFFKRTSALTGTKTMSRTDASFNNWLTANMKRSDGKKSDGTLKSIVYNDVKTVSEELKEAGYSGYEEADAQGIITLDEQREFLMRQGEWNSTLELEYQHQMNPSDLKHQAQGLFMNLKPQYFGNHENVTGFVPTFYKLSTFCLYPTLVNQKNEDDSLRFPKLNELYNNMKSNQVGLVLFASANKSGRKLDSTGKGQEFYSTDEKTKGQLAAIRPELIQTIDYKYFGTQVENKAIKKSKVISATQFRSIVQSGLFADGEGKTIKVFENSKLVDKNTADWSKEYDSVINELTSLELAKLRDDIGLTDNGDGNYKFNGGFAKLKEILNKEFKKRDVSTNMLNGLNDVLNPINHNKFLDLLVNKNKIENILFSLVNNNVIRQKMFGDMMVQTASTGFEVETRGQIDDNWAKSQDSLKFYRKGEKGETLAAECYLPHFFKEFFGKDEKLDLESLRKEQPELFKIIAFRIPTEQLNSIDVLEIKGFLPYESGNAIIVPSELVKKTGSDMDYDKLTVYMPNYTYTKKYEKQLLELDRAINEAKEREADLNEDPHTKKLLNDIFGLSNLEEYNDEDIQSILLDEGSMLDKYNRLKSLIETGSNFKYAIKGKKGLQNRFIELTKQVILSPNNFNKLIKPNSIDSLIKIKDDLAEFTGVGKESSEFTSIIEWKYILNIAKQYWKGKDLVGVFALSNKNHPLAQQIDLCLNETVSKSINFKEFESGGQLSLSKEFSLNEDGTNNIEELISEVNGQLISAAVDVAKDPSILVGLNINSETGNTISFLNRLGLSKEKIFMFMNQPIIREYIVTLAVNKGMYLSYGEAEFRKDIIARLTKGVSNNKMFLAKTDLEKGLKESKNKEGNYSNLQKQILLDFIHYKEIGQRLANLQQAVSMDTSGVGKDRNTTKVLIQKYNDAMKDTTFVNQDKFATGTYLKEFINTVLNSGKIYNELFYTETKEEVRTELDTIFNLFYQPQGNTEDLVKVLNIAENDILSYLFQTTKFDGKIVNIEIERLMTGENSLPRRVAKYSEKFQNTILERELFPILNRDSGIDNLKLFSKRLNFWESNELTNAIQQMFETDYDLAEDFIKFAMLQSGLNNSPIAFTQIIPNRFYTKLMNKVLDNFSATPSSLNGFQEDFFENNWGNNLIVPYQYIKGRQSVFITTNKKTSSKPYIKTVYKNSDGVKNTILYKQISNENGRATFIEIAKKGDGIFLKEFGVTKSVVKTNNKVENIKGVISSNTQEDFNKAINNLWEEGKEKALIAHPDMTKQDLIDRANEVGLVDAEKEFRKCYLS